MYFPKVYFPKMYFPKVYFSKVYFPKVYFSQVYCKYASILGPTIFNQNVTQSEAFKTERTQQLAHLLTFCKIINLTQQAENFRAKANSSSNGALTKSQSTKSYLCYHGLDQASIDEFVFPGTHLLSKTFD